MVDGPSESVRVSITAPPQDSQDTSSQLQAREPQQQSDSPPPASISPPLDQQQPLPPHKKGKPEIESLDYDILYSSLFENDYLRQSVGQRKVHVIAKWVVCMATGMMTGALAFVLDASAETLHGWKWELAAAAADIHGPNATSANEGAGYARAWVVYTTYCTILVVCACSLVLFGEPIAGGSGIPEVRLSLQAGCRMRPASDSCWLLSSPSGCF